MAIPAHVDRGTIEDIEHIVILMQENRSFDHYFGTLRGVRGYDDPRAVVLPSGNPVWFQPGPTGDVLPFHPTAPDLGLQFLKDLPHDWTTTHAAWNEGNYDQWVPAKSPVTMAHLTREDIPFHYALADAFTICDGYHCSLMGPTDPNRYYLWTGWVGNDGSGGGPVVDNAEAGYGWSTYPELLQAAGISWKIYQDVGDGLDAKDSWGFTDNAYIGNFGDNSLLYFHQYQNAQPGSPLYQGARTGTNISVRGSLFDILKQDVSTNNLPQVSWIVAPEAYCEHGNWPANYGAWYVSQVLKVLTANEQLWSRTALLVNFDENDGLFDHMVPPYPPQTRQQGLSTVDTAIEIFAGNSTYAAGPYGLGPRVPMIVVSPWSKGGWVCSQTFDHTSVIQFLEQRFGGDYPAIREGNISAWRRTVCGDLTSAFDFVSPNAARVPLPSTAGFAPPDRLRHPDYVPVPPVNQAVPTQEPGLRHARALPYEFNVGGRANFLQGTFEIDFANTGQAGACFQVRSGDPSIGPWTYTVEAGKSLSDTWDLAAGGRTTYDLSVYGPNGFFRAFKGRLTGGAAAKVEVSSSYDRSGRELTLVVANHGAAPCRVSITDVYSGRSLGRMVASGAGFRDQRSLRSSFGWYDLLVEVASDAGFVRRLAGHLETGEDSASDPAIGAGRAS